LPAIRFEYDNKHPGIRRHRELSGWLTLLCLLGVLLLTGCQVSVGGQSRPLVRRAPIRGSLEAEILMNNYEQETTNNDTERKSTEMRELLRLQTEGDVYHPNLLLYDAMIAFGLSQDRFEEDGEVSTGHGSVGEYRFSGQLLPLKSYPSSFYFERTEDVVPRTFGTPLNTETESRGFAQSLDLDGWQMTFSYDDYYSRQDGSQERDFYRRDEKNFNYELNHNFTELSELRFEMNRSQINTERFNDDLDWQEDTYELRHHHFFDEGKKYRLDSYFRFLEQTKDFDLEQTLWRENLRLIHTDQFETFYAFSYSETNRVETNNDNTYLRTGFLHQLYESLKTTGSVYASENNNNEVNEEIWGGQLGLDYTKKNPWGVLSANYFGNYEDLERTGGGTNASIIDEKHPFTPAGSLRFFLDEPNIDPLTIIIWNQARDKRYIENIDYAVSEINGLTEIEVLASGEIFSDGAQILSVDYDYLTDPDGEETSLTQGFRVRQDFRNGLGIYYKYQIRDQDSTSTEPTLVKDEYIYNIVGADFIKKGLTLRAEYRDEDSTRVPLTRTSLSGRYFWDMDRQTRLNIFARSIWTDFSGEESYGVDQFSFGGGMLSRLGSRYRLTSNVVFRYGDDERQGITKGYGWNTELQFRHRQLSYVAGLQTSFLDQNRNSLKTNNLYFYFRARRDF
jgi:hypothetical protein